MADFIAFDVTGLDELQRKLAQFPEAALDEGVVAANTYLVNVMHEYQPYQHIWRSRAFPNLSFVLPSGKRKVGYSSYRQFKYVHMLAATGQLPYQRTQTLSRGWKTVGEGRNQIIANETPYAAFVMGGGEQDRLHRKMGWKTMEARIEQRKEKILEHFVVGVKKAIRKLGL